MNWLKRLYILDSYILVGVITLLIMSGVGWGEIAISGDVNRDGMIDILDIQQGINMAIGINPGSEIADVNDDSSVDVMDIQVLVNTVLGVGGLVQPVEISLARVQGGFNEVSELQAVAFSDTGRQIITSITPTTMESLRLFLPVGSLWSMSIVGKINQSVYKIVPILFPIKHNISIGLPLERISLGKPIVLNGVDITRNNFLTEDLRYILGKVSEPLPNADLNNNQIPDLHETLIQEFQALLSSIPYLQTLGLTDTIFEEVNQKLGNCLQTRNEELLIPTLYRMEETGYPLPLIPVVECIKDIIKQYLTQSGLPNANSIFNLLWPTIDNLLKQEVVDWLKNLNIPELSDLNGNYLPDWLEENLCIDSGCVLDKDGNGLPDVIEDTDSDGIPNYLDEDSRVETDIDGDGIPNDSDWDANGNGILDYAEKTTVN